MFHYIIAKFKDEVTKEQQAEMFPAIKALFEKSLTVPGIHAVKFYTNCNSWPNRFDLMIEMTMDEDAIPAFNTCESHVQWKAQYGQYLANKCIFDRSGIESDF